MTFLKINNLNLNYFINFLIILLPVSFIAGNLIINLNLMLIIIFSLSFYGKEIFKVKLVCFDKLLVFVFAFCIFTSIVNTYLFQNNTSNSIDTFTIKKTFSFLIFLFFYFVLRFLVEKKIFNFKFFFISTAICSVFVSIDLIYQFINGKDIFGFSSSSFKLSGPFGDEEIAGSYLQRFSVFSFFLVSIYFIKLPKERKFLIFFSLLLLFFYSVFLAGNRMPIILFMLFWILLFIFENKIRKYSVLFFLTLFVFFFLMFSLNDQVNNYSLHFYKTTVQLVTFIPDLISNKTISDFPNTYIKEFYSGIKSWQENIFIGGGINSFHYNCVKTVAACASHPHNYYLEILSENGLIGMMLWGGIFVYIFYVSILKKFFIKSNVNNNNLITPFAILFFIEIFPIKTTGSFFTTGNATYIFFIMAVIIALYRRSQYN